MRAGWAQANRFNLFCKVDAVMVWLSEMGRYSSQEIFGICFCQGYVRENTGDAKVPRPCPLHSLLLCLVPTACHVSLAMLSEGEGVIS